MNPVFRPYQTEEDFWRMREFLRRVFLLNDCQEQSWHVARLEYARWHTCLNCANVRLEDVATLWEADGEIIAFVMPDGGPGEVHFNVHPGLGFHEGDIRVAVENRNDPSWYRNIQTAPLYRRDLDLVAIAPDGGIASFCTIWFDDVTRSAYFEPVATVPAHQRRGLGKALLVEGLHRLQHMGCSHAFVGGYSPHANALYGSILGPDCKQSESWVKNWA